MGPLLGKFHKVSCLIPVAVLLDQDPLISYVKALEKIGARVTEGFWALLRQVLISLLVMKSILIIRVLGLLKML